MSGLVSSSSSGSRSIASKLGASIWYQLQCSTPLGSRVSVGISMQPYQLIQTCMFSKYISKARTKRLPLTTKRVGKGYYKGNGARTEGRITSKGHFLRDEEMCTELVVPDLTNYKLKAYVGAGAKRGVSDVKVDL